MPLNQEYNNTSCNSWYIIQPNKNDTQVKNIAQRSALRIQAVLEIYINRTDLKDIEADMV
jgi:hypothetical protein